MIPRSILSGLGRLRRRERALRFVWGTACLVAVVTALIVFGCLTDFIYDRFEDTPSQVRMLLVGFTGLAAILGFLVWIVAPQFEPLPDDDLALMVEGKHPTFKNRLISAVQLNRAGANRQGMSVELIEIMTREAETQSAQTSFGQVADHGRVLTALKILVPIVAIAAGLFLWRPELAQTLLQRHFLAEIEIPHRAKLEPIDLASVYPAGEKLQLKFAVTGDGFDDASIGTLIIDPKGQPRERYPLKFIEKDESNGASIFGTTLSAPAGDFKFVARLSDGRMRKPGMARVVPRPAVIEQLASTMLPEYCGLNPRGKRYEVPQGRGDVIGIPGSSAKVIVKTQKPIESALIEILGPENFDPKKAPEEMGPVVVRRTVPAKIGSDKQSAEAVFDLKPEETAYEVVVIDEHKLQNVPPPRRNLRVIPEEAPTVVLLKDYFAPGQISSKESLEDFAIEGMPVPVGEDLRVPYQAEGPYGLGQAWFLYRILKKVESGNDIVEEEPFKKLPLAEVVGTEDSGAFDQRRGVFQNTPPEKGVGFVALPSPDPERILGRTVGGGRFHFKTAGIPDGKGGVIKLNDGDKIEYCIEVHADKGKNPGRPTARSETRVQSFGTYESLGRWIRDVAQEERRLRELDGKQRGVFANP